MGCGSTPTAVYVSGIYILLIVPNTFTIIIKLTDICMTCVKLDGYWGGGGSGGCGGGDGSGDVRDDGGDGPVAVCG